MARRRKKTTLIDVVVDGQWVVSAMLAAGVLGFGYILVPAIMRPSPISTPIIGAFQTISGWAGLVLSLVALVKFLLERQNAPSTPDRSRARTSDRTLRQTSANSESNTWVLDTPGLRETPSTPDLPVVSKSDWTPHQTLEKELEGRTWFLGAYEVVSSQPRSAQIDASTWSKELLQAIEWKRFEDLCASFYREKGIRSETTPLGADGGIDIRLYQEAENSKVTGIVQCKAWGDKQVGVQYVRELLGVMTHEKIEKGFFMAPGGFTDDAREIAKANRITLLDSKLFLAMIERLPAEARRRLLTFATEGDFTTPSCPGCGTKMVNRKGKRGNFWGCRNYPRCKRIMHIRKGAI